MVFGKKRRFSSTQTPRGKNGGFSLESEFSVIRREIQTKDSRPQTKDQEIKTDRQIS
jgi:hypothetical protein